MKRDGRVRELVTEKKGGYITKEELIIEIPMMFEKHGLVVNGDHTSVVGSYALKCPKKGIYGVSNMPTLIEITPKELLVVEVEDVKYYNYVFPKGSTIFPSTNVVQRGGTLYSIMNLYLFHNNQPWFLTITDLFNLLNNSSYYAKINTDSTPEINELFIALAARVQGDLDTLYKNGKPSAKLQWVSLADVTFLKSLFAKIVNNYQAKGTVSALLSKPNEPSAIERIARA